MVGQRTRRPIFSIGKSKAKLFDKNTDVKVTFKDVAGLEGAKEEIQEIVDFLKNPKNTQYLVVRYQKVHYLLDRQELKNL